MARHVVTEAELHKLRGLATVRVNRGDLLKTLQKNREAHRAIFLKALDGYKTKVVEELERRLEDARRGKRYNVYISLQQPEDHTKEYDRIITMLEMSLDDELELTQQDFAVYAMDDWGWKQQFTTAAINYGAISGNSEGAMA